MKSTATGEKYNFSDKKERNKSIIEAYQPSKGLRQLSSDYGLSQPGIRKILIKADVYEYADGGKRRHAKYLESVRNGKEEADADTVTRKHHSRKPVRQVLIDLRGNAGLDQEQAAVKLGISREHYSRIENCRVIPSDELWERLEVLYGLETGDTSIRATSYRYKTTDVVVNPNEQFKEPCYARVIFIENEPIGKTADGKQKYDGVKYDKFAVLYGRRAYVSPTKTKNINATNINIPETFDYRPEGMPEETANAILAKIKPQTKNERSPV